MRLWEEKRHTRSSVVRMVGATRSLVPGVLNSPRFFFSVDKLYLSTNLVRISNHGCIFIG